MPFAPYTGYVPCSQTSLSCRVEDLHSKHSAKRTLGLLLRTIFCAIPLIRDGLCDRCAIIEKLYAEVKGTKYFYRQLFNVINERNKQLEYSNVLSASQEKGMVSREDLNLDIQFERSNINTYKIVRNGDYVIHLRSFQGGFAFSEISIFPR